MWLVKSTLVSEDDDRSTSPRLELLVEPVLELLPAPVEEPVEPEPVVDPVEEPVDEPDPEPVEPEPIDDPEPLPLDDHSLLMSLESTRVSLYIAEPAPMLDPELEPVVELDDELEPVPLIDPPDMLESFRSRQPVMVTFR